MSTEIATHFYIHFYLYSLNTFNTHPFTCHSNLPAKSAAEERRHQKLYEQMVAAARKKELERAKRVVKKEEERRTKDKMVADSLKEWSKILPKWDSL